MTSIDYLVVVAYFLTMSGIGVWSMRRVKVQEDYFLGSRSFGMLFQTFAAFGTGTGSSDPVQIARVAFTSGMSGMWGLMYWLFVAPFYWVLGVWYRRMRHVTLGDWFVERYESKALGAAYAVFGLVFFMIYGSLLFSAVGKVAAPWIGRGTMQLAGHGIGMEYLLVPIVGLVLLSYVVMGGLRAVYLAALVQGLSILLLSALCIPLGLVGLVKRFGDPRTEGLMHGFRILHEQIYLERFSLWASRQESEFPLGFLVFVVLINLVGVVVQPHLIAIGGGSARTEFNARMGFVLGNLLRRLCAVGWTLTALIALALLAGSRELAEDPDKTWGAATRELFGPGFAGLMLACLLVGLINSVGLYTNVGAALVVRNTYAPYVNPKATEAQCLRLARITCALLVCGSVLISLSMMDLIRQLQLAWVITMLFAAPFWLGMLWRRATTTAAWLTVAYVSLAFFFLPWLIPRIWPQLRLASSLAQSTDTVIVTKRRQASPSDVRGRQAAIEVWDAAYERLVAEDQNVWQTFQSAGGAGRGRRYGGQDAAVQIPEEWPTSQELAGQSAALTRLSGAKAELEKLGDRPQAIQVGDVIQDVSTTGGRAVFWTGGVRAVDEEAREIEGVRAVPAVSPQAVDERTSRLVLRFPQDVRFQGQGSLRLDLVAYHAVGIDLSTKSSGALSALELLPRIVTPFLVMILCSLVTARNSPQMLDRFFAKMNTPVDPDPQKDRENLTRAYQDPSRSRGNKLFPRSDWEIRRPATRDLVGFGLALAACFLIVGVAVWAANLGAGPQPQAGG